MAESRVVRGGPARGSVRVALEVLLAGAAMAWSFWPTLCDVVDKWTHDPRYSHGYFVPAFALFYLWHRRGQVASLTPCPSAWGLALIGAGVALRVVGAYHYYLWFDALWLLPMLAGLCPLLGGRTYLRWCWPSIAFLFFMVPLPSRIEAGLAGPLQFVAPFASTFTLQALGVPATA